MTDQDFDRLADKMWERAPKAHSLTNKQVFLLVVSVFLFASTLGVTWNKILAFPDITKEQWDKTYKYSVEEQSDRELRYDKIINGFVLEDSKFDQRLCYLEDSRTEVKEDIKEIKTAIISIEKKIR